MALYNVVPHVVITAITDLLVIIEHQSRWRIYKCKEHVWKICIQLVSFQQFLALCVRVKGKMMSWEKFLAWWSGGMAKGMALKREVICSATSAIIINRGVGRGEKPFVLSITCCIHSSVECNGIVRLHQIRKHCQISVISWCVLQQPVKYLKVMCGKLFDTTWVSMCESATWCFCVQANAVFNLPFRKGLWNKVWKDITSPDLS